jgi:hypothetical protein
LDSSSKKKSWLLQDKVKAQGSDFSTSHPVAAKQELLRNSGDGHEPNTELIDKLRGWVEMRAGFKRTEQVLRLDSLKVSLCMRLYSCTGIVIG